MFIAALFTVAKTWKQPKRPSTEEWIKKEDVVHIYNGILLSHKKWSDAVFSNIEIIILSEVSQTGERQIYDITHIWNPILKRYKWTYLQNKSRLNW